MIAYTACAWSDPLSYHGMIALLTTIYLALTIGRQAVVAIATRALSANTALPSAPLACALLCAVASGSVYPLGVGLCPGLEFDMHNPPNCDCAQRVVWVVLAAALVLAAAAAWVYCSQWRTIAHEQRQESTPPSAGQPLEDLPGRGAAASAELRASGETGTDLSNV